MNFPPVTFQDNQQFYNEFGTKYQRHNKGLFILAPSGAGKTHYCTNQAEPHWIDGDELWMSSGAHPADIAWWTGGEDTINRVDQRSDVVTMEAKRQGFWIMGASNYWLRPDAIVIPDWETHTGYIKHREETNYDGGATSDALEQVKSHIEVIKKWHTDHGVPLFNSIEEAVSSLADSAS